MVKVCAEMHVSLYVKVFLKFCDRNETWNSGTVLHKIVSCIHMNMLSEINGHSAGL
jgi:hypothetical protein